jgi:hypothetical protein
MNDAKNAQQGGCNSLHSFDANNFRNVTCRLQFKSIEVGWVEPEGVRFLDDA